MSTRYSLNVTNNFLLARRIFLYQRYPEQEKNTDLHSLVWFSKACLPGTTVNFSWDVNYCFAWSKTPVLFPRAIFETVQTTAADPSDNIENIIRFTEMGGTYTFLPSSRPGAPGELHILTDGLIAHYSVSAGIGMSGQPALAMSVRPNMDYRFIAQPEYWIAWGSSMEGEVLDINAISPTAQIIFPAGTSSLSINLQTDNTWSAPLPLM